MADILIRGMEMPQGNEILVFDMWHGKMYARSTANTGTRRYEVVSLPKGHGRLIDADALLEQIRDGFEKAEQWRDAVENDPEIRPRAEATVVAFWECGAKVKMAPTIIEAEGCGEDG